MSGRVVEVDHGSAELIERIGRRWQVRAGWVGDAAQQVHSEAKIPVAALAAIHEYGAGRTPARPVVRPVADEVEQQDRGFLRRAAEAVYRGVAPRRAAEQQGAELVQRMRARIDRGVPPPLHPDTVAKKGHDLQLYDSGELYDALGYEVEVRR